MGLSISIAITQHPNKASAKPAVNQRIRACKRVTAAISAAFCSANSDNASAICCWACTYCSSSVGASLTAARRLSMKPRALSNTCGACSSTLSHGTTLRAVNHESAICGSLGRVIGVRGA